MNLKHFITIQDGVVSEFLADVGYICLMLGLGEEECSLNCKVFWTGTKITWGSDEMKYQGLYDRSPICFQNFMASVYGYRMKKTRFGQAYHDHIRFLTAFDLLSREEQIDFQFKETMKLIKHAINNSSFYRKLYEGIDITSFSEVSDLKRLPTVSKEMLRREISNVVTIPIAKAITSETGGTTGKSLTILYCEEDLQKRMATLDFFKLKHGFKNNEMKRATFNGKHIVPPNQTKKIFWRLNSTLKQMVYSSFHITDENIPYYIESLNRYKPESIDGFVSSIYDIASYMNRHDITFDFRPLAVFPTSETVTHEHRNMIEKIFECKVRDQYASSEGAPFVYECEVGNLHYDLSSGVIENVFESNEILVTSFTTYGTPLLRYQIGDSMFFDVPTKICVCGLNTPIIKSIDGRVADYLYATNGAKINLGNVSNIFKGLPNSIVKSQIIQQAINQLTVKIVVDRNYSNIQSSEIINEIKHKFGNDMNVKIQIVEDISREKSGKFRLILNQAGLA